ncbi:uncharacterized protein TRIADDRAFT_58574 [Trichoplax adhaerens]|uniref:Uncharacterized protein n=1 Tax=Trichoplax adhaerens TaxID=10228 RepID=B3S328_TRIAD|nr:hypothetical protein TRIADDRAFT_58574 [Trichoplax adhaerens]EDV22721.1 hypothetical protein TRIADDRAFT_58574 [Trichoplax adhaerens]|eukprot:XP_002114587.1 hypothetical protein TRIADDRAFT_58574 [Trichoplax adhaerens]
MASESLELYIAAFSVFVAPILVVICLRLAKYLKFSDQNDKNIVLIGCDTDCGQALLQQLLQHRGHIFATYKDEDKMKDLLPDSPSNITFMKLDPNETDEIDNTIKAITKEQMQYGSIWTLINLTGNGICNAAAEWCPKEIYLNSADDNLWASVEVIRRFLPVIKESRGRIIQLGCSSATTMSRKTIAYCVAKASLRAFIESLSIEMKRYSVSVHWIELKSCYEQYEEETNEARIDRCKQQFWNEISSLAKLKFNQQFYDTFVTDYSRKNQAYFKKNIHKIMWAIENAIFSFNPSDVYTV